MKLSPQQQDVVDFVLTQTGSLNVVARAGCGKTSTILESIRQYTQTFPSHEVFIGAYNKAIADEIKTKLDKAGVGWKQASAGTMHSAGFSAWRKQYPNVRVDDKKLYNIVEGVFGDDSAGKDRCGEAVRKLVGLAKGQALGFLRPVGDVSAWYALIDHHDLDIDDHERVVELSMTVYQMSLDQCPEVVDFDDMILAPLVFNTRIWPKDLVVIDEAQDTNPARRALALKMMKPRTGRMIAVGDDRQAIYGFTGADSDAMDLIRDQLNSKVLPLNLTFRCPKAVVAEAQKYVPDICAHDAAPEGIVSRVKASDVFGANSTHQYAASALSRDDVILCRNVAPLVEAAYMLLRRGVACKVEGRDIGMGMVKLAQRWKVKTLDAMLNKLEAYRAREVQKWLAKGREQKAAAVDDRCDCLVTLAERCMEEGKPMVADMVTLIQSMFGDVQPGERPRCLTLSTIHKSKGREWERVLVYGANKWQPSKYARKEHQLAQEDNLSYVAITRAQRELIFVEV